MRRSTWQFFVKSKVLSNHKVLALVWNPSSRDTSLGKIEVTDFPGSGERLHSCHALFQGTG